jgi:hypothetical protein
MQSLRACPQNVNKISVLVNDRILSNRQIVHIDMSATESDPQSYISGIPR